MLVKILLLCVVLSVVGGSEFGCYWNNHCSYQLFGSKTPYDTVRGDLRDLKKPIGCKAVSLWSIHRHGNRNPGKSVTTALTAIAALKDQIMAAYDQGLSQLCATDIDEFRKWQWNTTLETSASELTGIGYEELYDIAVRVKTVYPELLDGENDEYFFRPTNEQRTITSALAFVHGLTDGTNLTVNIENAREVDDTVRPYENCQRYQEKVKSGPKVTEEVEKFENSSDYVKIKAAVQQRLGISHQISTADLYSIYEMCRFYRSWDVTKKNPWCAVFTDDDLVVLDYRDDVRHYYRNGYGSWVNERLGEQPMKDLYDNMEAAIQGRGKKVVSYFTHDTMMEMVYCALGLYKDDEPLTGDFRNESRLWKSSFMGAKAINLIAVLNRCEESGTATHRVQIFIGEKVTDLCPLEGCTWQEFQDIFQTFTYTNLDFCSLTYTEPTPSPQPLGNGAAVFSTFTLLPFVLTALVWRR